MSTESFLCLNIENVAVFVNQFGRHMSATQVDNAIIRLQKCHLDMKRWRCHDLRHSFVYNYIKQGVNIYRL